MQNLIEGIQLIGFSESAQGKSTFRSSNPKTGGYTPWTFFEAVEEEITSAMQLASSAFPIYRSLHAEKRAGFLMAIADEIESSTEDLIQAYTLESGLPEGRARGELGRTTGQLRGFAALVSEGSWVAARIDTGIPDRQPVPKPDIRKCQVPLGPVVVFGASNFPFAFSTAGGDTASALAAGCTVVVKGHPLHPGTGEAVARCIRSAALKTKMPEGVFSHLQGSGTELGQSLVMHPLTRAVGFTGSRKGGMALSKLGQQRAEPIPVFAEMGSINPVVALPSAMNPSLGWAKAYAQSITLGAGQFCTNPGLILALDGPHWDEFTLALAEEVNKIPGACMLHAHMAQNFRALREDFLSQPGVNPVIPQSPDKDDNLVGGIVTFVSGKDFIKNHQLQREVFGPFTLIVACAGREELLEVTASLEGQLTASVLGDEVEIGQYTELLERLQDRVGRLLINGVPTGVEVCPSMHHGGPYPATTDSRFTSVGTDAILRWTRPLAFQNYPQGLLPPELQDGNPLGIWRMVNGKQVKEQTDI